MESCRKLESVFQKFGRAAYTILWDNEGDNCSTDEKGGEYDVVFPILKILQLENLQTLNDFVKTNIDQAQLY